jgi:hypothetical protein
MHKKTNHRRFFELLAATAIVSSVFLTFVGLALAAEKSKQGEDLLRDLHHKNITRLEKNSFGLPLFLDSFEKDERVNVDVCGIFDHSFGDVLKLLTVPENWCDIVSLHPNVKACTYREQPGAWMLSYYIGRKKYQTPEDAHLVVYQYRNIAQRPGYLDVLLTAADGPFGTKDHRMRFEAIPLDGGKTFVCVNYAYSGSVGLRVAEKIYFATLGWGKEGFTVTGADRKGSPVYIGGPRGALERNAVRYYLALQSFMDTLQYPEDIRFSMRTNRWYDLTDLYKRQLFDLDKKDYLTFKTKEHINQGTLQRSIVKAP